MSERILIVEDEAAIAMTIRDRLESEGYSASVAADGDAGFRRSSTETWSLIVLEVMLPGRDGLTLCRDLRGRQIDVPILMLTAKDQTLDKVLGLKIGADDYLTKPFEMAELLARIEALLRRSRPPSDEAAPYAIGPFVLDPDRQELQRDGQAIALSTQEFKLLRYLYDHRGAVVDRDELLAAVWGYDGSTYTRTVDVHVSWLRQKLGDSRTQRLIATVRGRGYRLTP